MTFEHSHPSRHAKIFWRRLCGSAPGGVRNLRGSGCGHLRGDFFWPPIRTLVELVGLGVACRPFLVEPVQVRFVVGDPFLDGLPRWLHGLHGVDVEGRRWRAREMDNTLPEAVEAEEELSPMARRPLLA